MRPTYHLNDDDVLDQNPDGNWEALDVRCTLLLASETDHSKAQHRTPAADKLSGSFVFLVADPATTLSKSDPC